MGLNNEWPTFELQENEVETDDSAFGLGFFWKQQKSYFNWVPTPRDKTKRNDIWGDFREFADFDFQIHPDKIIHKRTRYSVLDWLGDIGGLYDGLRYFFGAIIFLARKIIGSPLNSYLVKTHFKRETAETPEYEEAEAAVTRINQRENYYYSQLCSFLRNRKKRKLFDKGLDIVTKEFEIKRFLKTQKMMRIAISALFSRVERFLMRSN